MVLVMVDGVPVEMGLPPVATPTVTREISSGEFLALWTPAEVAATMAIDPELQFAALGAIAQGVVNMDSPRLAAMLAMAVTKGTLTSQRAAQIASGTPPVSP